jgi:uncharacterized Zn-binding protein involved in type VI secretion
MPIAAHITSSTTHGGALQGTGIATVKIGKFAAAVAGDPASTLHKCSIVPPPAHLSLSPVTTGSTSVFIGGKPAARVNDPVGCGATILSGAFDVLIGG